MKAWSCITPGELRQITVNDPPVIDGNVILKIRQIGVCGTDLHAFEGTQPYFSYPRILGHELVGEMIDGVVPGVSNKELVTILPYFHCGHCVACRAGKFNCCAMLQVCGVHVDGGMVDYLSVPAGSIMAGEGLTADELALVEPLSIGSHAVRRANVQPGEFVLVMGAGPIGLGTMSAAVRAGGRVIAMDIVESRLRFAKEKIDVHHTVNGKGNALEEVRALTNGDWPTTVIDATGNAKAIMEGFSYMAHGGKYILVGLQKGDVHFNHPEFHKRESTLMTSRNALREDFAEVMQAMQKKKIKASDFITHRVSFDEVGAQFQSWLDPANGIVKAMIQKE